VRYGGLIKEIFYLKSLGLGASAVGMRLRGFFYNSGKRFGHLPVLVELH
jgi:hypothetical protein